MIYAFADFELDEESWELREGGNLVETPPKALETLSYLVRNRHRVVPKSELLDAVWGAISVSEASLSNSISLVRSLLHDDGQRQTLIKTARSRGYRFVGSVRELRGPESHIRELSNASETLEVPNGAATGGASETATSLASDGFVGRKPEIALLLSRLEKAAHGSGGLVLVSGDAGIGKTRLLEEFANRAQATRTHVYWAWCCEEGGAPELWPWIRFLRPLIERFRADTAALSEASSLAFDAIQSRIANGPQQDPESPAQLPWVPLFQSEQARFRFFESVRVALCAASHSHPLVLLLEDLHAADSATLFLVHFLARELKKDSVLVVATYRPGEIALEKSKSPIFGELVAHATLVQLGGLTETDMEQLALRRVRLNPEQLSVFQRVSEGNPLFAESILSLLATDGAVAGSSWIESAHIPPRIAETIRKRLDKMPPETRALLACAAVVGRQFHLRLLQEITGEQAPLLLARLESALLGKVLGEVPGTVGVYRFVHGLFRQIVYDGLPARERSRLHHLTGLALERILGIDPTVSHALLAHHFLRGGLAARCNKGLVHSLQAAKHAIASFAYDEAAAHYANALSELQFDTTERHSASELLVALGYAHRSAGDHASASKAFGRAMVLAREMGDILQLGRAALGQVHSRPETGRADHDTIALLEEIIALLSQAPAEQKSQAQELLAIARCRLSMSLSFTLERARCDALSREALELSRRVGGAATVSYALHARHWAIWKPSTLHERLSLVREMLDLDPLLADGERMTAARVCQITDLLELGELDALETALGTHRRLAESFRDAVALWNADVFACMRLLQQGQFDEAQNRMAEALVQGQRLHPQNAGAYSAAQMLWLRLEQGRAEEVEPVLRARAREEPNRIDLRSTLAHLYAELENETLARPELEYVAHDRLSRIPDDWALLPVLSRLAVVCEFLNDRRTGELVLTRMQSYSGQHVVLGPAIVYMGPADYYLGLLTRSLGRLEDACECFEKAIASSERLRARPMSIRARLELARTRIQSGGTCTDREIANVCAQVSCEAAALGMRRVEGLAQAFRNSSSTPAGAFGTIRLRSAPKTKRP